MEVFDFCRQKLSQFRGRMLIQSERWDRTHAAMSAKEISADTRQADKASTILTGWDLFLFDDEIDELRLADLVEPMTAMISGCGADEESSEGRDALDFLLCSMLNLDHGLKRSVKELLEAAFGESDSCEVAGPEAALYRHGILVCANKKAIVVRSG